MSAPLPPLLRAPPFPWADATVSHPRGRATDRQPADPAALFALVREARVGGPFWDDPVDLAEPAAVVLRPRRIADLPAQREALAPAERGRALWIAPDRGDPWRSALDRIVAMDGGHWRAEVDPWSALAGASGLVAHGDDEWVALARIADLPVQVLSPGAYGTPQDDYAALAARAAQALSAPWRDPFTGGDATIEATVELLACWRAILQANRPIAAACGMAWWKRTEIRRFLWHPRRSLRFVSSPRRALAVARAADRGSGGAVAIWPSRVSPSLLAEARARSVPLVRVEDGFVRSVGLGVDLVPPSSVVVDATGIHYDPSGPSDLETLLEQADMPPRLLDRARALRERIVAAGISKYGAGGAGPAPLPERQPGRQSDRRLVLVPAQVEDDMSVLAGGGGVTNLELLRRARALEPGAEIWFRPHPDVDAGHRKGALPDGEVLRHADRIVRGGGMAPLLDAVDGVHVLTSLTGFEALMRGRDVTCHGRPFYAGWGLTRDLGAVPARRTRTLTLDALVAGVLILYPRYLDPVTGLPCPPEVLVSRMAEARAANRLGWIAPLRRLQGRLTAMLR